MIMGRCGNFLLFQIGFVVGELSSEEVEEPSKNFLFFMHGLGLSWGDIFGESKECSEEESELNSEKGMSSEG